MLFPWISGISSHQQSCIVTFIKNADFSGQSVFQNLHSYLTIMSSIKHVKVAKNRNHSFSHIKNLQFDQGHSSNSIQK